MANRFWVLSGGTGTWNATATGKWSTTSGGASGAAVPTAADDVFFDTHSGAGTITLGATGVCRSLTTTGYTGIFTGSSDLNIGTSTAGSLTIASGMTWSYSGSLSFVGTSTNTINSNGKTIATLIIQGIGATVTLNDALNATTVEVLTGTFATNGKNTTLGTLVITGVDSNNRTLNLGASAANIGTFAIDQSSGGTSTITPGTSQITMNTDGGLLESADGTAFTLNRLVLASATNASGGINMVSATGILAITVNDYLGMTGYVEMGNGEGLTAINLTGNLHLGGVPALQILNDSGGTATPFDVSGTITTGTATLKDIDATTSSTPWNFASSGATITDAGNNFGITFPTGGSVGSATGTSTVSGNGVSIISSVGSSTGATIVSGASKAIITSIGTATGTVSVAGISLDKDNAVGTAVGISSVFGVGATRIFSVGTSLGVATVLGTSPIKIFTTGTALGTCMVQGQGNLIPQPSPPQPTENALNVLLPTENALNILNPVEYGEDIKQPTEYAA